MHFNCWLCKIPPTLHYNLLKLIYWSSSNNIMDISSIQFYTQFRCVLHGVPTPKMLVSSRPHIFDLFTSSSSPQPSLLHTTILLLVSMSLFVLFVTFCFMSHIWVGAYGSCPFPRQYNIKSLETFVKLFFLLSRCYFSLNPEFRCLRYSSVHICK